MIKKLGNRTLLLILIILLALFGIMRYISNKRGEDTFKTAIIPKIDTNKLNKITIFPKYRTGKPFSLDKKGDKWYVSRGNVTSLAEERSEHNLVQMVQQISPDRLASNSQKDWKDLNVNDSLGTRIVFFYGSDTILDLIVGRFSYIPGPSSRTSFQTNGGKAYSAVRINKQNDVYKVEGFLTLNISDEFNAWRNKKIMPSDFKTWNKLTFTYPADSGFTLKKDKSGWVFGNGMKVDSLAAANAIRGISEKNYGTFIDNYDSTGKQAIYTLKIEGTGFGPVLIKVFPADSLNKFAIGSTLLPGSFFSGKDEFKQIFLTKSALFKREEKPKVAAKVSAKKH